MPSEEVSWGMSLNIVKSKVGLGIYLLRFRTQYELAATFLRVQEYYESPRFRGRIFSLEQYMDWYAARHGSFTYYQDWSGFNIPSTALQPFFDGKFDPLSEKEKQLLRLFKGLKQQFYVIGVFDRGAGNELVHELAHALFFTDAAYRTAVRTAMRGYDTTAIAKQLTQAGYAKQVIPDETQAYLVAPSGGLGAAARSLGPLRKKLRALFHEHARALSLPDLN
jgi:hypothetical protein